jgi:hypothetical protein
VQVHANPLTGTLGSQVNPGHFDGASGGSAAIGLGLESTRSGTISVRPYVEFDSDWYVFGIGLSARSAGHIGLFVATEDGTVVSNTQDYQVFDVDGIHPDSYLGGDAEVLRSPYQEVRFLAEANRHYQLWIWVNVFGDQSGGFHALGLSWSDMYGSLDATVRFIAVEFQP